MGVPGELKGMELAHRLFGRYSTVSIYLLNNEKLYY